MLCFVIRVSDYVMSSVYMKAGGTTVGSLWEVEVLHTGSGCVIRVGSAVGHNSGSQDLQNCRDLTK